MNLKMWINSSKHKDKGAVGHDDNDYDCETFLMIEYYVVDGYDLPVEEEEKNIKVFN